MPVERTGVAVAASSASLALDLLCTAIEVSKPEEWEASVAIARRESANLQRAADEDVAAYNRYLARRASAAEIIAIPLGAARSAGAGIELCLATAGMLKASVAADLGVVTELLAASLRAMLLCVDANLGLLDPADPYHTAVRAERIELERSANQKAAEALKVARRN